MYTTNNKRYIGIAGTIGAGKSTLAEQLSDYWHVPLIKEPISPYLADFYVDNKEYAFRQQVYMMASRVKVSLILSRFGGIQDRTIYEDRIFQKVLCDRGDMEQRDYETCSLLYKSLSKPSPDVVIYLKVKPETSIQRQKDRARETEIGIDEGYMQHLLMAYNTWASEFTGDLITIPWDNPLPVEEVAEQIESYYDNRTRE